MFFTQTVSVCIFSIGGPASNQTHSLGSGCVALCPSISTAAAMFDKHKANKRVMRVWLPHQITEVKPVIKEKKTLWIFLRCFIPVCDVWCIPAVIYFFDVLTSTSTCHLYLLHDLSTIPFPRTFSLFSFYTFKRLFLHLNVLKCPHEKHKQESTARKSGALWNANVRMLRKHVILQVLSSHSC